MLTKEKHIPKIDFEKMPKTVAIVGSRSFDKSTTASAAMQKTVTSFVRNLSEDTEIVSGGAVGIDSYAADIARTLDRPLHIEWPDERVNIPWRFLERNERIVKYVAHQGGIIIAFVDIGAMRGTLNTLTHAKKFNVPRVVYKFGRFPLRTIGVDQYNCDVLQ